MCGSSAKVQDGFTVSGASAVSSLSAATVITLIGRPIRLESTNVHTSFMPATSSRSKPG